MNRDPIKLKIAVLYDGAGLARLGLEQSGHECIGVELDPIKHQMSQYVGSGNSILADVLTLSDSFFDDFDAVWTSPPCQSYSDQKVNDSVKEFGNPDCLPHSIELVKRFPHLKAIWIENVFSDFFKPHAQRFNAVQFLEQPIQRRRRLIGGKFRQPHVWRDFKYDYPEYRNCPPAPLASEWFGWHIVHEGNWKSERKAFGGWHWRNYNRRPTLSEMATAQGLTMPKEWEQFGIKNISEAIGNGVPVFMAKAFGDAYSNPNKGIVQSNFFELVE